MTSKKNNDSSDNSNSSDETTDISKGAKLEKYMTEPAEKRLDNLIGAVNDKDERPIRLLIQLLTQEGFPSGSSLAPYRR